MVDPAPEEPADPPGTQHISAQDARGGEIILRKTWERIVFIAGLAGALIFGLVLAYLAWR
jgi:hypothetical protein